MPRLNTTYGTMTDSLVVYTTNDGWMKRALSNTGDTLWACGNNGYENTDNLYLQKLAYNADNDTLSCTIGGVFFGDFLRLLTWEKWRFSNRSAPDDVCPVRRAPIR